MPCAVLFYEVWKYLNFKKIFGVLLLWGGSFGLSFTYMKLSDFTTLKTSFLSAFLFAVAFSASFYYSKHFRCTVAVFFIQCFSHFGILMLLIFFSWMFFRAILESIISLHDGLEAGCGNTTGKIIGKETMVKYLVSAFHYGLVTPFLCLFLYSFLYVFTKSASNKVHTQVKTQQNGMKTEMGRLVKLLLWSWAGGIFSSNLTLFLGYVMYYKTAVMISVVCDLTLQERLSSNRVWFYFAMCLFLLVLTLFSKKVMILRSTVISKFFDVEINDSKGYKARSKMPETKYEVQASKNKPPSPITPIKDFNFEF